MCVCMFERSSVVAKCAVASSSFVLGSDARMHVWNQISELILSSLRKEVVQKSMCPVNQVTWISWATIEYLSFWNTQVEFVLAFGFYCIKLAPLLFCSILMTVVGLLFRSQNGVFLGIVCLVHAPLQI